MDDLVALVRRTLDAEPPRAGSTRVLAVDGPSGAGKSALADRLAPHGPIVRLDDIYPGWDGLAAAVPRLVDHVLRPLAEGRPARYRRHDWAGDRPGDWVDLPPAPVLVVEGAGAGALACAPYLSVLVWIDAPPAVRRARAMARDGDMFRPHWDRWAAQETEYFTADTPWTRAQIRFDSADSR